MFAKVLSALKSFYGTKLIVAVTTLLIIMSWWFVLTNLEARREGERERAQLNATRINTSLTYSVARVSSELDTLLLFMRSMKKARGDAVTWQEIVTEDYTLNRQTVQIAIIAKDGMMVTSSKMLYPKKPVDLSDRVHYKVHVDSGRDELYISEPVLGRASKKWSIQYTRPLLNDNGEFSGVIVVSLSLNKIIDLFDGANIGRNGGIAVVGHDGVIRAGAGRFADMTGKDAPKALIAASDRKSNVLPHQIVSVQQVDNYPLRVIVSIADPGMIGWYWTNKFYLLALGMGTLIILTGAIYLAAQHQKQISLLEERRRLELDKEVAIRTSRLKSDFLSVMSHEIRTPLNGILGSLELISVDNLPKSALRQIEIARSSGFYLLSLIDDILVFMKSDGGDVQLDEQFHSIRNLFNEVSRSFSQPLSDSNNKLVVDIADDVPDVVKFDVVKLRQVLTNLLGNANKFTQGGTLTICVSLLEAKANAAKIRFSIKDTGIGIPKSQHSAIFERFTSLDSSLSRRSDGTGLGLTICKKIINSMQSEIRLESEVGQGSCFSFVLELPLATAERQGVSSNLNWEPSRCEGLRVLLAEDNETNAYIATEFLSANEHKVDHVRDGNQAIAAAQKLTYDIILMDLSMPRRDGLAAAKAIRAGSNPNMDTPIVALTAHVSSDTSEWVANAGMNGYLTKPISREQLLEAVERYRVQGGTKDNSSSTKHQLDQDELGNADDKLPVMDLNEFREVFGSCNTAGNTKLLSSFLADLSRCKRNLKMAVEENDEENVRRIAHSLAGSSGAVCAERLSVFCRDVENYHGIGPAFDWDKCRELINLIDLTVIEAERAVEDLRAEERDAELEMV